MTGRLTFALADAPVDVAVIVVTYRSEATIGRLLESLRKSGLPGLSIAVTVVDNASDDGTCAVVARHQDVRLIDTGGNIGYGGGINVGLSAGPPASVVLVLNPDLEVDTGAIGALVNELCRSDDYGIAVPLVRGPTGIIARSIRREPTIVRTLGDVLFGARWKGRPSRLGEIVYADDAYTSAHDIEWATGAAFAMTEQCLTDVGPWDERFFLYSEEVDFARRAREHRWRVRFVPHAVVVHDGGGSGRSPVLEALQLVSRVRYSRKHQTAISAALTWIVLLVGQFLRVRRPGATTRLLIIARPWTWSALVRDRLGGDP